MGYPVVNLESAFSNIAAVCSYAGQYELANYYCFSQYKVFPETVSPTNSRNEPSVLLCGN